MISGIVSGIIIIYLYGGVYGGGSPAESLKRWGKKQKNTNIINDEQYEYHSQVTGVQMRNGIIRLNNYDGYLPK